VTKNEVAWLLIRLAGIWLLWQAVEGTVTLISTYLFLIENDQLNPRSAGVFWQMGLSVALHLALGVFCLSAGGNILFHIVTREDEDAKGGPASILK
jgi:hypothetical protein